MVMPGLRRSESFLKISFLHLRDEFFYFFNSLFVAKVWYSCRLHGMELIAVHFMGNFILPISGNKFLCDIFGINRNIAGQSRTDS